MADATPQVHDPTISKAITASGMEARSYDEQCRQIYKKIYKELKRPDEHQFRFVTIGTAREVLRGDNFLPLFFHSLVAHGEVEGLTTDKFVSRIEDRDLYDFLAILIFATCSIEAARAFTTKIVSSDEQRVTLPATRQYLTTLFGNDVDADKFCTAQAPFCTLVIKKRGEVTIENPEGWRLPYLDEQPLGEGAFGKVFKVRIARGHFIDHEEGSVNLHPVSLARKDYIVRSEFPPRSEREIMDQILSAQEHNNILKAYGNLDIKPNTYSLFMPLAMCDLGEYMLADRPTAPPGTTTEKAKFIKSAHGLAAGLNFLHREMHTPNMDKLVCYHMDLKPANILVFQEQTNDDVRYVWKISDFGMARVKIRRHGEHRESENDFDRWFIPRLKVKDPTPTGTRNWRMEGTYLAPESIVANRSMKAESDVWSLGCVLSVVLAYLEGGREMALQYRHERTEHHDSDGLDRFFLRATGWSSAKLHPVVKKWHKDLIEKATRRDVEEGLALKYILDYIKDSVLEIKQNERVTAGDVRDRLEKTSQKYFNLGKAPEGPQAQLPGRSGKWKMQSRLRPSVGGHVKEWRLHGKEPFTGCTVSSDATLVAYWTDIDIFIYTSESLAPGESRIGSPAAGPYSLAGSNCIWKTVCLTEKYLIASTTGGNFHCYIFDLQRGKSVGANFDNIFRSALHFPEIAKMAICPESKTLACILPYREESYGKSSIFLAPISELIKSAEKISTSSRNQPTSKFTTYNTSNSSVNGSSPLNRLRWSVTDITHVSFSTCHDIYLIVRPELTVRSREHTVSVIRLNIKDRTEHSLVIDSQGLDVRGHTSLFTSFASFHKDAASCAIVTHQMRLHIHRDVESDKTTSISKEIRNYRVHRLMMEWHDNKIFALGTASGNQRMLLLMIKLPLSEADDISIKELAQLPSLSYDGEFTERLSTENGKMYVLIASVERGNRHAIYKICLPGEDLGS